MLDPALAKQLSAYLTKVVDPVELVSSLDESATSGQLADLLDEIASLSAGRITHVRGGDAARRPSFRVVRVGTAVEVEFAGMPLGHEFTSLVLALLQVGGHPATAATELLDAVRGLTVAPHLARRPGSAVTGSRGPTRSTGRGCAHHRCATRCGGTRP